MGDLMNEFSEMMNDRISIYDEAGKLVAENELALVDGGKSIITDRGNFIVDIGYLVKRKLPNGLIENYRVIQPNYYSGSTGMFKAHYQMKVTNVKAPVSTNNRVVNNITVSDNARLCLDMRYKLMPYIYSNAAAVSMNGTSIMRPFIMDFANDELALKQKDEYMFGKSLLVAPVFEQIGRASCRERVSSPV